MPHRNTKDIEELDKSLQLASQDKCKNIILAGDFNCPDIDWNNLTVKNNAQDKDIQRSMLELTSVHGLTQIHDEPTRGNNQLDLVLTSNPSLVKSSTNIPGISDHAIIITDMDTKPHYQKTKATKRYIYSKANWDNINKDLENTATTVEQMYRNGENMETLWNQLTTDLFKTLDENIPSKQIKSNNRLPWMNHKLKKMLKKKQRLYNQAKKTKNWKNYKHFQKECKKHMKKAELDYINNTIIEGLENNNSKPFWKYIKSRKQDNIGVSPLKLGTQLVTDGKEKAEILVKQFQSVFTTDKSDSLPTTTKQVKNTIPKLNITSKGVAELLKKVNPGKASGPDNIPNRVLKECAEQLAPSFTCIFQLSVDSGELPVEWLNANISCIFKKGDKHQAENYRPVSLTSVPCKLLEHIICKHMLKHLERNKVLTTLNHGFRSGYSCETQLLTTMNDLLKSYDTGKQVDIAILDFSKAFDTVPHKRLLHKLSQYGIRGPLLAWLTNFLTNRKMRVALEGEFSEELRVDSGVPQGTVLGPILFLCHINDLPDAVQSTVRLFADDCLLYREINNQEDHHKLQKDLENLEKWADTWGMRFNAKKCYILSIKKKSQKFYTLNGHILEEVSSNPYLGLQIADDLRWNIHITNITKKASSTLGFLRRNLQHCPIECRKIAYISMVRSILEYGATIWDPYIKKEIDQLEKIQRRGARFIKKDYKSREEGCVTKMLEELQLTTLEDRRRQQRLIFLHKVVEGQIPAIHRIQQGQKANKTKKIQ